LALEFSPGVIDQGECFDAVGRFPVAGEEFVDERGELGDVGPVAGVGVGDQRDPAVAGDDQAQADQARIDPFLFGLAARRDRRRFVGRVDERGEVRHVQDQSGQVQGESGDDTPADLSLDRVQIRLFHAVQRVPDPAVVQRRLPQFHPAGARGGGPPVG
jgi:hypothetical protein